MSYLPIEEHGLIGNMRTAALVGINGAIDWLCWPKFDSPSVFAALLDDEKGGVFQIAPADGGVTQRQLYWPETNVLITRFLAEEGVVEVIDYMPVGARKKERARTRLIRRVESIRGKMPVRMVCRPAFDYARTAHKTEITGHGAAFRARMGRGLGLSTHVPLGCAPEGDGVEALFTLEQGERASFVLEDLTGDDLPVPPLDPEEENDLLERTIGYWRQWLGHCTYEGRWREQVYRSALALKLMTYEPTGAIIAAPTCSLPEDVGGERNWDYRYTWVRDAAFTVYGFMRIGFTEEAAAFLEWIRARCEDGLPQIVYSIDGETDLSEEELDHLSGYRGSKPVRIGNGAYDQLQLDIYGELLDAVYLSNKYRTPISYDYWTTLKRFIDWVCENWQRPDAGLWEVRGGDQHFVYSKLMCWVALDRALRLAEKRSFPAPTEHWRSTRDEIYHTIMEKGWDEERGAFVQHFDSDVLDASNLIMPLVFFMSPNDPRMLRTLDAVCRAPSEGGLLFDSLVYRYNTRHVEDGMQGDEGTFNMCTFWLVEALTRAGRTEPQRLKEARLIFEKMLGYANHLGLYGEETGACGETLGNFPQAFTHLALISAAFNLDRTLDGRLYGKLG